MNPYYFITGTDTDAGKTLVASALLLAASHRGFDTLGFKPIAAGCEQTDAGLHNSDALALVAASSIKLPYEQVNPVALKMPMAPHIAAKREGYALSVDELAEHYSALPDLVSANTLDSADSFSIMEGAGGWRVPLNATETMADLVIRLQLPVILVVGLRLGCLNHALLTQEAIANDGLVLAGWVATQVDEDMVELEENFATLKERINAPCIGFIPFQHNITPKAASKLLDIDKLLV